MKKNYLIFCRLLTFIITALVLLLPVIAHSQDLTEEQKAERCQNNKNRIVELEMELKMINADLSQTMEKKEMEDAKTQLIFVRSMRIRELTVDWNKYDRISAQYNFKNKECYDANENLESPLRKCIDELEKIIVAKIDKAVSLENLRPALINKKKQIDKQLASHRTNLIALGCDDKTDKATGTCKLAGKWVHITEGIGTTTWTITSDGKATEEGKGYAKGIATLKGNTLHIEWHTNNGYSGYYEWRLNSNCSSDDGELVFKSGGTGTHKSTVTWSQ